MYLEQFELECGRRKARRVGVSLLELSEELGRRTVCCAVEEMEDCGERETSVIS